MQTAKTEQTCLDELLTQLAEAYDAELTRIDQKISAVDEKLSRLGVELADAAATCPSVAAVRRREYDDLIAAGQPEAAAQKLKASKAALSAPGRLSDARDDYAMRRAVLQNDRENAARKVLDEWMPKVIQTIRVQERSLYEMLNSIEAQILAFTGRAGKGAIDVQSYIGLLVSSDGQEGEARKKWFTIVDTRYLLRK